MKTVCFWTMLMTVCASYSYSDTLFFKNGNSYSCDVIAYSNSTFTVILNQTVQQTPVANIDRIEFTQLGQSNTTPIAPVMQEYDFQEQAKFTPSSYMAGKSFGDAVASCSPKDVIENVFTIETNCIKLLFERRGDIEQISATEYTTSLYGADYSSVRIYFDAAVLKYIRAIKDNYAYGESKKKYAFYGVSLSPKTLESFQSEYRWGSPVFIPIGRTSTKGIGQKSYTYSWQ